MAPDTENPKTALVACSRLVDFAGAEMTALEIAEALRDLGFRVTLAALEVGPEVANQIDLSGIEYIDLSVSGIMGAEFELIWVSHYIAAYHLLVNENVRANIGVFSSLSYFEAIEAPPLPSISFSRYVVNSDENLRYFIGRYPEFANCVDVFPNAAPVGFFSAYQTFREVRLTSIAIISNHPPRELSELIPQLERRGIKVDLIGQQGKRVRVSPEILSTYSAVITIGKSVQYCLAQGVPVFCYDHFGGPGWITLETFEAAFAKNFSGRCTYAPRTSHALGAEILSDFIAVVNQRDALRQLAQTHFDLGANLHCILAVAGQSPFTVSLSTTERHVLSRESKLFLSLRQIIANNHHALAACSTQISELDHSMAVRDGQITELGCAATALASQIDALSQAATVRDKELANLNLALDLRGDSLDQSRAELSSVLASTSWRLTLPLRTMKTGSRVLQAHSHRWWARSKYVLQHEGLSGFSRRTLGFIARHAKRKIAAWSLERFVIDSKGPISVRSLPLVSFVIPIYDRTDLLRAAIASTLRQTISAFEVILVTDGSPPATLAVVNEFRADPRVKIFNYPVSSGNAVRGRNKGILEARGKYIAFLDSDDIAAPDRLEVCLPLLESGAADVVYGAWRALLNGTRETEALVHGQVVHSPDCDLAMLETTCVPCQSTVMVRREMLMRAGFLKPRMQYREDHELWVRLAFFGARFKSMPHVLADLRLHAGNNELNFKGNDLQWESLVKQEYRLPGPRPKKIAFLLAGLGISGGAAVVLKHVSMLMEAGHDAFVIDVGGHGDIAWFGNPAIPVYRLKDMVNYGLENIDMLFATFWSTCEWLDKIPSRRKLYLVQSDERLFYEDKVLKRQVERTYRRNYEYVVIAQWLAEMFRQEFKQQVTYVPNGIDDSLFYPDLPLERKNSKRLRVLIEGPISVPFKGMAEAYAACSALDCELWIVSSNGRPDVHWKYDRFFEGVNQSEMRSIYSSCDVLLKMSRVESFAYPPLEAMACGCAVVVGEVRGGIEYARDGENVLKVPLGDVTAAKAAVRRLLDNAHLRNDLLQAGFATVKQWTWAVPKEAMLGLVDSAPKAH